MSFYDDIAATAVELLAEFGAPVTLTSVATGSYDPATGQGATTPTNYPATGVKLDYEQREIDGTNIRSGDQRVYLAPDLAVTPKTGDRLTVGASVFQIIASRPLSPATTTVLHDVQVRR
jgi:hypothetical protein